MHVAGMWGRVCVCVCRVGKSRFTVVCLENNTTINKYQYKNQLFGCPTLYIRTYMCQLCINTHSDLVRFLGGIVTNS